MSWTLLEVLKVALGRLGALCEDPWRLYWMKSQGMSIKYNFRAWYYSPQNWIWDSVTYHTFKLYYIENLILPQDFNDLWTKFEASSRYLGPPDFPVEILSWLLTQQMIKNEGVYPWSKEVDFFFHRCHKFHLFNVSHFNIYFYSL